MFGSLREQLDTHVLLILWESTLFLKESFLFRTSEIQENVKKKKLDLMWPLQTVKHAKQILGSVFDKTTVFQPTV